MRVPLSTRQLVSKTSCTFATTMCDFSFVFLLFSVRFLKVVESVSQDTLLIFLRAVCLNYTHNSHMRLLLSFVNKKCTHESQRDLPSDLSALLVGHF